MGEYVVKKFAHDMTLAELIMVVAIVALIASIGYSTYLERIKTTQRTDGMEGQPAGTEHVEDAFFR